MAVTDRDRKTIIHPELVRRSAAGRNDLLLSDQLRLKQPLLLVQCFDTRINPRHYGSDGCFKACSLLFESFQTGLFYIHTAPFGVRSIGGILA